jgi:hypothetical protein
MASSLLTFLPRQHGSSTKWEEVVARPVHMDLHASLSALPTFALVFNVPSDCPLRLAMMETTSGLQLNVCSCEANGNMQFVSFCTLQIISRLGYFV